MRGSAHHLPDIQPDMLRLCIGERKCEVEPHLAFHVFQHIFHPGRRHTYTYVSTHQVVHTLPIVPDVKSVRLYISVYSTSAFFSLPRSAASSGNTQNSCSLSQRQTPLQRYEGMKYRAIRLSTKSLTFSTAAR